MTTFLLVLNFALLIVAFFIIIILYLRQSRMQDVEKHQTSTIKEMEDLLSTYLLEMKEENAEFLSKVNGINRPQKIDSKHKSLSEKQSNSNRKEKNSVGIKMIAKGMQSGTLPHIDLQIGEENPSQLLPNYRDNDDYKAKGDFEDIANMSEKNTPFKENMGYEVKKTSNSIEFIAKQVLSLKKQGFSIEKIAKQLNKGKTEIELLLKFRQN